METFELWEGKEDGKKVRRLIRANAVLEDNAEANARVFFKLYVENLRHIGDAQMSVKEGESSMESLGLCWVQQNLPCKGDS
jgi:hypothetical protein